MKTNDLVALIMAGGRGERLWPRSTSCTPKHLLKFGSEKTMIEETIERLRHLVSLDRIFIVTGKESAAFIKRFYPKFPPSNIIIEPYPRDTAACIGLAAVFIKKRFPRAVVSIFPSDHVIRGRKRFLGAIRSGAFWAEKESALVSIGIKPGMPETGYGYIELGREIGKEKGVSVHRVKRFIEKPDLKRAKKFVVSGRYLWNGGMFIFKIDDILMAIKILMPGLHRGLLRIEESLSSRNRDKMIKNIYKNLKGISIDYGIMERAANRLVVVTDFFWNDVGSWISLEELYSKDKKGNIFLGDTLSLDTSGSIFVSDKGLIAAIGLKDMAVVSTQNATIVFPKDRAQEVKRLVEAIRKKRSLRRYL